MHFVRRDLHGLLLDALRERTGVHLNLGHSIVHHAQDGGVVTVRVTRHGPGSDSEGGAQDLLIEGDTTRSLDGSQDLVYASQEWLSERYVDDAQRWGVFDEDRWNAFYGWLSENELTSHDLTGKGFTNDFLP